MGKDSTSLFGFFGISDPLRRLERELKSPKAIASRDLLGINHRLRAMRDDIDQLAASATSELFARVDQLEIKKQPDQCDWAERGGRGNRGSHCLAMSISPLRLRWAQG